MFTEACRPPAVSALGTRIRSITVQQSCALTRPDAQPKPIKIEGSSLQAAMQIVDRSELMDAEGVFFNPFQVDGCSVSVRIDRMDFPGQTITVSGCDEPHICTFLTDAIAAGYVPEWGSEACVRGQACRKQRR